MITAFLIPPPITQVGIMVVVVWCWLLVKLQPGRAKDLIRGFGIGTFIALGIISLAPAASGADEPLAIIETPGNAIRVYGMTDPITGRRFLVARDSNGLAMIEATPVPVAVVPVLEPTVERGPPPPPSYWDDTVTWSFNQAQANVGYFIVRKEMINGRELYHIRRKNPAYVEPAGPEKP